MNAYAFKFQSNKSDSKHKRLSDIINISKMRFIYFYQLLFGKLIIISPDPSRKGRTRLSSQPTAELDPICHIVIVILSAERRAWG